jgi:pimeloyl-ACP methyl ester carboxylesterase
MSFKLKIMGVEQVGKSNKSNRLPLIAVSSLGALAIWRIRSSPWPQEDLDCVNSMENTTETFHTEDGVELKLKRYVNEGGQPLLLAHGFTGNGLEFDLPHRGHNLALYLAERGYDVWISSFRGCGNGPYRCRTKDWDHSVDELAALDAPALVNGVTLATGRTPIWVGHSMGGIVLYMYLLGATVERTNGSYHTTVDPSLIEERNRSLLGSVTIASPPSLTYGGGDWIAKLESLPFYRANARFLVRYLESMGRVSPKLSVSGLRDFVTRFPRLGRILAQRGPIAIALYNPDNVDADVGYSLLKWASDNVSTRMASQFLALALDPELRTYSKESSYTANMHRITSPLLFITGSEDFVGAENIRLDGYEKVSSPLKRFKFYDGYGHTDLVMGKRVEEEVYPVILSWIEDLSSRSGTSAGKSLQEETAT